MLSRPSQSSRSIPQPRRLACAPWCALTTVVYTRFLEMAAAGNFLWRGVGGGSVGGGGTLTGGLHSSCAPRPPSRAHACAPLAARRVPYSVVLYRSVYYPTYNTTHLVRSCFSLVLPYWYGPIAYDRSKKGTVAMSVRMCTSLTSDAQSEAVQYCKAEEGNQ